jgi:hypothetical protein
MAAASDPQAQRWLGWSAKDVVAEEGLERLLALRVEWVRTRCRAASPSAA